MDKRSFVLSYEESACTIDGLKGTLKTKKVEETLTEELPFVITVAVTDKNTELSISKEIKTMCQQKLLVSNMTQIVQLTLH